MSARLFHCTEGDAHKFWSIALEGITQTVCFGRIGTSGQIVIKTFDSAFSARKATAALIRSKRKKGYREVPPEEATQTPKRERTRVSAQLPLPF